MALTDEPLNVWRRSVQPSLRKMVTQTPRQTAHSRDWVWCWLSGWSGWLGILGSWIWAPLTAELTPGGVDSACHPPEVSVLVKGTLHQRHSHAPKNESYLTSKLPYARRRRQYRYIIIYLTNSQNKSTLWCLFCIYRVHVLEVNVLHVHQISSFILMEFAVNFVGLVSLNVNSTVITW